MSHPRLNIVVEGPTDTAILRAVLADEHLGPTRFFVAGGRISLASLGRNLLVHEGDPVVVIMDGDSHDQGRVEELQGLTRTALRQMAPDDLFEVFVFVPEIEVVFFEAPIGLERMLSMSLAPERLQEGLLAPKQTLLRLCREHRPPLDEATLIRQIDVAAAQAIRAGTQMAALIRTLETLMPVPVAA